MLKDSSVIICSIVRDAAKGLKNNIPVINAFLKEVKDYHIIIFENDSKDDTKKLLMNWAGNIGSNQFHLTCEDKNEAKTIPVYKDVNGANPNFSAKRISKMVDLRNQYLNYIEEKNITADYVLVVDLDVAQLQLDGLIKAFDNTQDWDAVCANGISTSPALKKRYHDAYALTEWGRQHAAQTEQIIKSLSAKYANLTSDDGLVRVYSAFGGLAIYKFHCIAGLRYQLLPNDNERVEVKCEHYSICHQMINNGHNRIFINPSLQLKYQSIDATLIANFFKKKLGLQK